MAFSAISTLSPAIRISEAIDSAMPSLIVVTVALWRRIAL